MEPKQIPHPKLDATARRLTPLEMNALHFARQRTVLTPEIMSSMADKTSQTKA